MNDEKSSRVKEKCEEEYYDAEKEKLHSEEEILDDGILQYDSN